MSSDIFVIYQIDNSEKNREYRCRSYEYQIQHGFMITADNYGTGYSGTATALTLPCSVPDSLARSAVPFSKNF